MAANFDELTFDNLKMTNNADVDVCLGSAGDIAAFHTTSALAVKANIG